ASLNEFATVEMTDSVSMLSKYGANADLIFIDPPYADFGLGALFVKKLGKVAKNGTVLIWEFESNQQTPKIDDVWTIAKDKTYGRARFLILRKI
ncbi:MAG: RsmD family RNA methyltransferase, partial [Alphaproteobacteria bacterium]|nr:RsmD family RNA methyltransferase [Alphaproteobacteria bacterium]